MLNQKQLTVEAPAENLLYLQLRKLAETALELEAAAKATDALALRLGNTHPDAIGSVELAALNVSFELVRKTMKCMERTRVFLKSCVNPIDA